MNTENLQFSEKEVVELSKESEILSNLPDPYIIKNHVVFSPGTHNGAFYSKEAIKQAYHMTQWKNPKVGYIYFDHNDEFGRDPKTGDKTKVVGADARDWVGKTSNLKYDEKTGDIIADLIVVNKEAARAIAFGVNFGISPRGRGERRGSVVRNFLVDNFALVVNPAIKSTYLNSEGDINYGYFIALSNIDNATQKMDEDEVKKMKEELGSLKTELDELKTKSLADEVKPDEEEKVKKEKEKKEEMAEPVKAAEVAPEPAKKEEPKKETEEDVKDDVGNGEMKEDISAIKKELTQLKDKLTEPKDTETFVETQTGTELTEKDVDEGMIKTLQSMKGYEVY